MAREAARQGGAGSSFVRDAGQRQRLAQAAAGLKNSQLRECIQAGVGFHHAAMEPEERAAVEALFIAQDLPVGSGCGVAGVALGLLSNAFRPPAQPADCPPSLPRILLLPSRCCPSPAPACPLLLLPLPCRCCAPPAPWPWASTCLPAW
jgi:hypothetical protein